MFNYIFNKNKILKIKIHFQIIFSIIFSNYIFNKNKIIFSKLKFSKLFNSLLKLKIYFQDQTNIQNSQFVKMKF